MVETQDQTEAEGDHLCERFILPSYDHVCCADLIKTFQAFLTMVIYNERTGMGLNSSKGHDTITNGCERTRWY